MSWWRTMLIALLCAASGAVAAGYVAELCVDWYSISSFEGGSGYFVVGMALLGLLGGLVLGVIVSRVMAARAADREDRASFARTLGAAQLTVLGTIGVIGVVSRLAADVPPKLNGEELLLAVEIRWSAAARAAMLRNPGPRDTLEWRVQLSSASGGSTRDSRTGPLWKEDARTEGGDWIVPGAVQLFTQRGKRLLTVTPDSVITNGFDVPLPSYPKATHLAWSDWLPRDGSPMPSNGVRYRFRVVPVSQPIRTERVGPFEVQTIASSFRELARGVAQVTYEAGATFAIRHAGQSVIIAERDSAGESKSFPQVDAVAEIGGGTPSLVVVTDARYGSGTCHLVVAEGARVRSERLANCGLQSSAFPLTSDSAVFWAAQRRLAPQGRIDRESFARPGLYMFDGAALDTRTLAVHRFTIADRGRLIEKIPPLALSPDERSFVRLRFANGDDEGHALAVTDFISGESQVVPTGSARVLGEEYELLDPTWLAHYFMWTRGADGHDRLQARPNVQPMVHRGRLTEEEGYREYRVMGGTAALRSALVDFIITEFNGERVPTDSGAYAHEVRVNGRIVNVSLGDDGHVGLFMERNTDTQLVATIARRFDAALATRKYDVLFAP